MDDGDPPMAKRRPAPADGGRTSGVPPTQRGCYNCVYGYWDKGSWLASLSGWVPLPMCVNHPDSPGQMRPVAPAQAQTCRNFRPRWQPPVRGTPPKPPDDDTCYIALTKGKFALVDKANYEWLSQYKWHLSQAFGGTLYAARSAKGKRAPIRMHREIMKTPKGMVTDHINGNGLDNRECNMRNCKPAENKRNCRPHKNASSKYKGVSYEPKLGKYVASICPNRKYTFLGCFDDEIEAARAYDRAAVKAFGQYAYLNFPEEHKPVHDPPKPRRVRRTTTRPTAKPAKARRRPKTKHKKAGK